MPSVDLVSQLALQNVLSLFAAPSLRLRKLWFSATSLLLHKLSFTKFSQDRSGGN
jgi:hypothetical protein